MTSQKPIGGRSRKKATNLSIDADLLAAARKLKINLSRTFEMALAEKVRALQREAWLAENREAIEAHNRFVERHGVWSDGLRQF
jgi:antitoxin CcdA